MQEDDSKEAEKLLTLAIKELKSVGLKHGHKLFDTKKGSPYAADNMIFPRETYKFQSSDSVSVGEVIQYMSLGIGIHAENGEFTLVSYGSKKAKPHELKALDLIVYETGKRIKASDAVGPSDHHYTIEDLY